MVIAIGLGLFFEVYEIFLSSTIATALKTQYGLGGTALQLLLASSFLGMFVGAVAFGRIADRIGRRRAFLINLVWFSVWSAIGAVAPNPWILVGSRFMAGIGVGAECPVADSYLSDVLPKAHRGRLTAWAYTCSFLAVPALGFLSLSLNGRSLFGFEGWRVLLLVGAIGALLVLVLRRGLPESPRWLAGVGRIDDARAALRAFESGAGPAPASAADSDVDDDVAPASEPVRTASALQRLRLSPYRQRLIMLGVSSVPALRLLRIRHVGGAGLGQPRLRRHLVAAVHRGVVHRLSDRVTDFDSAAEAIRTQVPDHRHGRRHGGEWRTFRDRDRPRAHRRVRTADHRVEQRVLEHLPRLPGGDLPQRCAGNSRRLDLLGIAAVECSASVHSRPAARQLRRDSDVRRRARRARRHDRRDRTDRAADHGTEPRRHQPDMIGPQTSDIRIPSFAHYAQQGAYALSMVRKAARGLRLATQVLVLQVAVVTLTLGIAGGLIAFMSHERLAAQYETRSLDMARAIAFAPAVRADVARYDAAPLTPSPALTDELANGPLQTLATEIQQRTGVLFVVITNDQGIRLSHPNRDELGKHVSTDPTEALAGHEVVMRESGTLGPSVRAKVPVLAPNSNRVVGEVSIGISTAAVHHQLWTDVRTAAVLVGVALLIGVVGSVFLARRWRGLTMGLQPSEMAELIRGQAAVLHGIDEGVLAVDTAWKTTFVNDEACRLLEVSNESGRPLEEIGLTPRVLEVFRSAEPTPTLATVGDRIVVVSARHVARDGRDLGTVLVVRDRTDVESLTRQLDAVQLMSTVLRAQRHEFANRLHLLNGLLHSGHAEEAAQYVEELLGSGPLGSALPGIDTVRDAFLQAFLAAKAASAREAGVTLTIGENTWVPGRLALPVDVTTVLGNLLDNAIDAARTGAQRDQSRGSRTAARWFDAAHHGGRHRGWGRARLRRARVHRRQVDKAGIRDTGRSRHRNGAVSTDQPCTGW